MSLTRSISLRSIAVTLVFAVATAAAVTVVSGGPAAAAPSCRITTCNGEDPEYMGCARTAVILDDFTYNHVYVKFNISYTCGAYWAKFENPLEGQPGYEWVILVLWTLRTGGIIAATLSARLQTDSQGFRSGYTAMWNFSQYWGQVCMSNSPTRPTNTYLCTARH